jgi:glycine betaine/choline ABC-type transport system substrate-binding protein
VSRYPEIINVLAAVENLIDEKTMRHLNYQVDQQKMQVEKVVRDFLVSTLHQE